MSENNTALAEEARAVPLPENSLISELVQIDGIVLTPTSLDLRPDLEVEGWESVVHGLSLMERGSPWWLGDALVQGDHRYGSTYEKALKATGYSRGHLQNVASVARRVPAHVRRPDLPWNVHAIVAALEESEQQRWLELAAEGDWSAPELTRAMKCVEPEGKHGQHAGAEPPSLEHGEPCPICGRPW